MVQNAAVAYGAAMPTSFTQLVSALREQMSANLSRTDALRPLSTMIIALLIALVAALKVGAVSWVLATLVILVVGMILIYAAAYTFFALKDRDALRSEKYTLNKMAIEHGLLGDSKSGIIELEAMKPKQVQSLSAQHNAENSDA